MSIKTILVSSTGEIKLNLGDICVEEGQLTSVAMGHFNYLKSIMARSDIIEIQIEFGPHRTFCHAVYKDGEVKEFPYNTFLDDERITSLLDRSTSVIEEVDEHEESSP